MAVSGRVQQAMYSPARVISYFGDEGGADGLVFVWKAEGHRNVRKHRYVDFVRSDGKKVYAWKVSRNA